MKVLLPISRLVSFPHSKMFTMLHFKLTHNSRGSYQILHHPGLFEYGRCFILSHHNERLSHMRDEESMIQFLLTTNPPPYNQGVSPKRLRDSILTYCEYICQSSLSLVGRPELPISEPQRSLLTNTPLDTLLILLNRQKFKYIFLYRLVKVYPVTLLSPSNENFSFAFRHTIKHYNTFSTKSYLFLISRNLVILKNLRIK